MKSWMTSIAAAGLLATAAIAQTSYPAYSIADLGPVGGPPGQPYFLADNGLIAGSTVTHDNKVHAAVWFMGFQVDLGAPGLGGPNSVGYGINPRGQVVGAAESTVANSEDFCGFKALGLTTSATSCLPFLWQNGAMTKLPTLGGANGAANMINNQGEAVGYAETATRDPNAACPVSQFAPVIWGKNGATQLKTFTGDPDGVAAAINENGQAVGASGSCTALNPNTSLYLVEKHALLWESGVVIDLGNLGGTGAGAGHHACALNNRGQVVGHSDLKGDTTFHAFVWTWQTGMRDIGTLPGDMASLALSISDRDVTVGASLDSDFNPRAMVFANGVMTDLNDVVSRNPQELYLLVAGYIDSRGEIIGLAVTSDGDLHGFLATPDTIAGTALAARRPMRQSPLSASVRKSLARRLGIRER